MLETLTLADFAARVDEPFVLDLKTDFPGLEPLVLTLAKAEAIKTNRDLGDARAPFSLLFQGPAEPVLGQRIYPLDNEVLGRIELFLVPLGPVGDGMRYEAVFS